MERGIHWRAAFLQWAKWPVLLVALIEAVLGRRVPYSLTGKTRDCETQWRRTAWALLWPHAFVAVAVAICWAVAAARPGALDPALVVWSAVFFVLSASVVLTGLFKPAPPFDPSIVPFPIASMPHASREHKKILDGCEPALIGDFSKQGG
jgi:hypothetical protein